MQRVVRRRFKPAARLGGVAAVALVVAGCGNSQESADTLPSVANDPAIAAFSDAAVNAGFEGSGTLVAEPDLLTLRPEDDEDASAYECTSGLLDLIDADSRFIGERGRAVSERFVFAPEGTSEQDAAYLSAAVVYFDDASVPTEIVETFGSSTLRDCLADEYEALVADAKQNDPDADVSVELDGTGNLDLGELSAELTIDLALTQDDKRHELRSELALATVGNALVIVNRDAPRESPDGLAAGDALATLVAELPAGSAARDSGDAPVGSGPADSAPGASTPVGTGSPDDTND